jgi:hypothetical protein
MIVQQPGQSDADYYKALSRQLDGYEAQKGRYAGVRATEVRRQMRAVWNRMQNTAPAASGGPPGPSAAGAIK